MATRARLEAKAGGGWPGVGPILHALFHAFVARQSSRKMTLPERTERAVRAGQVKGIEATFLTIESLLFSIEEPALAGARKGTRVDVFSEPETRTSLLESTLRAWDEAFRSSNTSAKDITLMAAAHAALTAGVWRHWWRLPKPARSVPLFCQENQGTLMRWLDAQATAPDRYGKRELLAEAVPIDLTEHQHILAGRRPVGEDLAEPYADVFAKARLGRKEQILADLRMHYSLHRLTKTLAGALGWQEVERLGAACAKATTIVQTELEELERVPGVKRLLRQFLRMELASPVGGHVQRYLALRCLPAQHDARWRRVLLHIARLRAPSVLEESLAFDDRQLAAATADAIVKCTSGVERAAKSLSRLRAIEGAQELSAAIKARLESLGKSFAGGN